MPEHSHSSLLFHALRLHPGDYWRWDENLPSLILKPTLLQSVVLLDQISQLFELCSVNGHTNSVNGWRREVGHGESMFEVI